MCGYQRLGGTYRLHLQGWSELPHRNVTHLLGMYTVQICADVLSLHMNAGSRPNNSHESRSYKTLSVMYMSPSDSEVNRITRSLTGLRYIKYSSSIKSEDDIGRHVARTGT
jgi:hypothetical protein